MPKIVCTAALLATCLVGRGAFAANNEDEVRKGLEEQYHKVLFGPKLNAAQVAAALASKGKTLIPWAADAAKWLGEAQIQITAETIREVLVEGRSVPEVSGGIAAINHWHVEKIPYVKFKGIESEVLQRDVRIPEPNEFMLWVGIRRKNQPPPKPAPVPPPGFNLLTPNVPVPGQQAKYPPAVAVLGNRFYMVWVANNPSNDLLYSVSDDGQHWHHHKSVPGEKSGVAPALAACNGKLVLAFIDAGGDKKLCLSVYDPASDNWSANVATDESSQLGPTLVVKDNRVFVYLVSKNPSQHILQCVLTPK